MVHGTSPKLPSSRQNLSYVCHQLLLSSDISKFSVSLQEIAIMKQMKKQEGQMKALKAPDFAPSGCHSPNSSFVLQYRRVACVPFMVPPFPAVQRLLIGCHLTL